MKLFVLAFIEMLLLSCCPIPKFYADDNMEKTEEDLLLSKTESVYLNKISETTRNDFDFINKKIGLITISGENGKTHYFDMQEKHLTNGNSPCDNDILYIFNSEQKDASGGCDAAIVYWSKRLLPIEQAVKRLKLQS